MQDNLTKVFGPKGCGALLDTSHLKLTDGWLTFQLLVAKDLDDLCTLVASRGGQIRHKWYYKKIIASLAELRSRSSHIKRISICGGSFSERDDGRPSFWEIVPDGWISKVLPGSAWRDAALAALPRLEDLSIEGSEFVRRYKRSADGTWTHWYTGEKVKWLHS